MVESNIQLLIFLAISKSYPLASLISFDFGFEMIRIGYDGDVLPNFV
jgi:hypothetical protein